MSTISHELRTPLAGILGTLDLLMDTPLHPSQVELIEAAQKSGESLLLLISDILDISKVSSVASHDLMFRYFELSKKGEK